MYAFLYGDSVTPPPSQITRLSFDQVGEIYTDGFYGSRRGFINMSWDRPDGIAIILVYRIASGKLLREKTFTNFAIFQPSAKVFSMKV